MKVTPTRGTIEFGKRGKLTSRYVDSYKILERVGRVAYRLVLTLIMTSVHNVCHISMLNKYILDAIQTIAIEEVQLELHLSYREVSVAILGKDVRKF